MLVCAAPRGGTGSLLVGQPPAMHRAHFASVIPGQST